MSGKKKLVMIGNGMVGMRAIEEILEANPFMILIPGYDKEGAMTFHDIYDYDAMFDAARNYKKAAVIGGGLLGLEAAKGLLYLGMDMTVIHDQVTANEYVTGQRCR